MNLRAYGSAMKRGLALCFPVKQAVFRQLSTYHSTTPPFAVASFYMHLELHRGSRPGWGPAATSAPHLGRDVRQEMVALSWRQTAVKRSSCDNIVIGKLLIHRHYNPPRGLE